MMKRGEQKEGRTEHDEKRFKKKRARETKERGTGIKSKT